LTGLGRIEAAKKNRPFEKRPWSPRWYCAPCRVWAPARNDDFRCSRRPYPPAGLHRKPNSRGLRDQAWF